MLVSCLSTTQQALRTLPEKETTDVMSKTAKQNLLLKPLRASAIVLSHACHLSP